MRNSLKVILLPALVLAFAACGDEAVSDGGGTTGSGTSGQDGGMQDSGPGSCPGGCPTGQTCNTATNQCRCPGDIGPCTSNPNIQGGECCGDNFTCGGQGLGCVCNPPGTYCTLGDASVVCINTTQDPNNCGGCGKVCTGGYPCVNSQCNYPIPDSGPLPDSGPPNTDAGPLPDSGVTPGTPCDPTKAFLYTDVCQKAGLNCVGVGPDGGPICAVAGELTICNPAVGCDPTTELPLHCIGTFNNGTVLPDGGPYTFDICVYYCSTSPECPNPTTTCQQTGVGSQSVCFSNYCTPQQFYKTCDVSGPGANDGTCIPSNNSTGQCYLGGTIPTWDPCGIGIRTGDGGTAELCGLNDSCVIFGALDGGSSMCAPICSGSVAGGFCAAGQTCFGYANLGPTGLCIQDCDITAPVCPGSLQCVPFNQPPTNECIPIPDAG